MKMEHHILGYAKDNNKLLMYYTGWIIVIDKPYWLSRKKRK